MILFRFRYTGFEVRQSITKPCFKLDSSIQGMYLSLIWLTFGVILPSHTSREGKKRKEKRKKKEEGNVTEETTRKKIMS